MTSQIKKLHLAAMDHINYDHVRAVALALRATGQYGSDAIDVATDVLAMDRVLNGPDGGSVRALLGLNRSEASS